VLGVFGGCDELGVFGVWCITKILILKNGI